MLLYLFPYTAAAAAKSLQLCLTLCNLWTVAARFLCPQNFPGKNTGVGGHFLHQGIFLIQGSKLGLLHCRQTLPFELSGDTLV